MKLDAAYHNKYPAYPAKEVTRIKADNLATVQPDKCKASLIATIEMRDVEIENLKMRLKAVTG